MNLRAFNPETDFDIISSWIKDERSHAMWCANRFQYPLVKSDFLSVLSEMKQRTGDHPFVAATDDDKAVGFLCYSLNRDLAEGRMKFVIVDPEYRGKGTAREMLRLALTHAFEDADTKYVSLIVFSENPRAKKCYEKIGFRERNSSSPAFAYKEESWNRCSMIIKRQTEMNLSSKSEASPR